jgi:ABC-type antimicrobial peptide transport system permease subunit
MARKYWPGQSAIGKTFHTRNAQGPVFEIVGVTADHKVTTVAEPPTPFIQVARTQQPNSYSFVVARTRGDAGSLLGDMRRTLLALEPNLVFVEAQTMEAEVATTLFPVRVGATLVTVVGMVAMLLAAIGLYGVIAYSVARQTREIGIRMALGARPANVLGQVMRHGFAVTSLGVASGCVVAAGAAALTARFVTGALYGVGLADPVSWGVATALLIAVSSLANFIPAWRAAHVQPSIALRTE